MNKHKNNQIKPSSLTLVLALASLVATALLAMFVFTQESRMNTLYDQQYQAQVRESYNTARITFCYDNNVHPCTDGAIEAWNNKHPEDHFNLAAPNM